MITDTDKEFYYLYHELEKLDSITLTGLTIFGEAQNQAIEGQIAVGYVIKNRVIYWNKSYQDIILAYSVNKKGKRIFQFSCWQGLERMKKLYGIWKGDIKLNSIEKEALRQIYWVVDGIMGSRIIMDNVDKADHYYNWRLVRPLWAMKMKKIRTIQDHVFYRSDRVKV